MDSVKFDRLARTFAKGVSRRGLLAVAGGFAIARRHQVAANQLTPSTCGASGEVCTLLMGCCDGLTCVTSAINTNYGVCIAGEGGTVSIGTTLISPFSEGVEQEVAALANGTESTETTDSTTTTTDTEAEREQRIADKKLRKENRRDDQKLRKQTQQNEQKDRREDQRDDRELRRGPKLELELFNAGSTSPVETLRVTNRDDVSLVLTEIQSLIDPSTGTQLTPPITLGVGDSFLFLSNGSGNSVPGRLGWGLVSPICSQTVSGDGFVLFAGLSANSENHEYRELCDGSINGGKNKRKNKKRKQAGRGRKGRNSKNKNR